MLSEPQSLIVLWSRFTGKCPNTSTRPAERALAWCRGPTGQRLSPSETAASCLATACFISEPKKVTSVHPKSVGVVSGGPIPLLSGSLGKLSFDIGDASRILTSLPKTMLWGGVGK